MRFRLIKLCDCTLEYIHYVLCVYQHDLGMVQKHQRLDSLSRVITEMVSEHTLTLGRNL